MAPKKRKKKVIFTETSQTLTDGSTDKAKKKVHTQKPHKTLTDGSTEKAKTKQKLISQKPHKTLHIIPVNAHMLKTNCNQHMKTLDYNQCSL